MTRTQLKRPEAQPRTAEVVREYGPYDGADKVHGVTHDGTHVWAATGAKLLAIDPASAIEMLRSSGVRWLPMIGGRVRNSAERLISAASTSASVRWRFLR